jgi:hypothetical protein
MMDSSGDIKGTFFNDDCDKWMSTLQVNQVYKIKGGQIKQANEKFNNCSSTNEITFGRDTIFEILRYSLSKDEMRSRWLRTPFFLVHTRTHARTHTHTHTHKQTHTHRVRARTQCAFKSMQSYLYLNARI